ncbi:hypothetical protein KKD03_04725 [Patescibacteria group bacterium]|nr:hypothetical protein [Patescibacteria group bacterium]
MKKTFLTVLVVAIIVGTGSFYGGMKYAQRKSSSQTNPQNFRNLSAEDRAQRFQQMGNDFRGAGSDSNFASGEIIAKDAQNITIKLSTGGSKIIFFSDSAEIGKFTAGNSEDLEIGKTVMINGKANDDGSITAQSIQIRPETTKAEQ